MESGDYPKHGVCFIGSHDSVVCFRFGPPERPRWICYRHLLRIVTKWCGRV